VDYSWEWSPNTNLSNIKVWNPNSKVYDLHFWNNGILIEIKSIEVVKVLFGIW
jgi:hypothetical protein